MSREDWRPTARLETLRQRSELLRRLRRFFYDRGFMEVETPLLSADVVVDRHLDPISVVLPDDPRLPEVGRALWLQTSPEFGMKRLLAAGAEAIFQITRAFRAGEHGGFHNPEFTMLEWYRAGDDMRQGIALLSELAEELFGRGTAEVVTYADVFQQHAGIDPHTASTANLRLAVDRLGIRAPESFVAADRDAWLDLLLVEYIQPRIGASRPTIVCDYPASQAALACTRRAGHEVAERFELYVDGMELANGYHELLDPQVLRERASQANRLRTAEGKPALPEDSRLLAAMESGLPACSGVALGFDRALMIVTGAHSIQEVIPFPIDRA